MSRVLVTGGSGFIAFHLIKRLVRDGHEVYITGHANENPCEGQFICHDFIDIPWVHYKDLDALFHFGGCTDTMIGDRRYMMHANYDNSRQLFDSAIKHGVKSIIYSSSAAVYGKYNQIADEIVPFRETDELRPLNVYGESKMLLDIYAQGLNLPIMGLRYSNVYGGRTENHKKRNASMCWQIFNRVRNNQPVTLFAPGTQARDFVYIDDVVNANILAWRKKKKGVYNIGAGKMWTFNEVAETAAKVLKTTCKIEYVNNYIQEFYQDYNAVNIDKARELGYEPMFSLEDGMSKFI